MCRMDRLTLRVSVSLLLISALVALAGCGGTAGPSAEPTLAPTPAPSTGAPTEVPVETPGFPDWTCDGSTVRSAGTAARAQQTGMTVLTKDDVGEIAFEFRSIGGAATLPEVEIRQSTPPFTLDPSGLPVAVDGAAWATIVLRGGTGLDENFEQTYPGPDRWTTLEPPLVEVVRLGDFEAISTWAVGLSGPYCVRAYPGAEGSVLVVEFRAR